MVFVCEFVEFEELFCLLKFKVRVVRKYELCSNMIVLNEFGLIDCSF